MRGGVTLTDTSAERWFKALPSRQFGTALPINWQQSTGLQIIEASTQAREVIPQPKLQPNLSKEIRRCWQFALLSRAPRKPFNYRTSFLFYTPVGQTRVSPIPLRTSAQSHDFRQMITIFRRASSYLRINPSISPHERKAWLTPAFSGDFPNS